MLKPWLFSVPLFPLPFLFCSAVSDVGWPSLGTHGHVPYATVLSFLPCGLHFVSPYGPLAEGNPNNAPQLRVSITCHFFKLRSIIFPFFFRPPDKVTPAAVPGVIHSGLCIASRSQSQLYLTVGSRMHVKPRAASRPALPYVGFELITRLIPNKSNVRGTHVLCWALLRV